MFRYVHIFKNKHLLSLDIVFSNYARNNIPELFDFKKIKLSGNISSIVF